MHGRVERLADGVEPRESETSKRRDCLLVNGPHTFDEAWCVLGVLECEFKVVDDWQPRSRDSGSFGRALPFDVTGAALAQVVHVGQCPAEPTLELSQLPRLRTLGFGLLLAFPDIDGHVIGNLGSLAWLASAGRQAVLGHSFTVKSASIMSSSAVPPLRSPGCSPAGCRATSPWRTCWSSEVRDRIRSIGAFSLIAWRPSATSISARAFSCVGTDSPSSVSRRSTW